MIWFTADTHLWHPKIIEYCNRPFKTVEEMSEVLLANWNFKVSKKDMVFHLGDFGFSSDVDRIDMMARALNGSIHLVYGNHDEERKLKKLNCFAWQGHLKYLRVRMPDGRMQKIMMSHYPMCAWRAGHKGSWMLHRHSHGTHVGLGKKMDVGVDAHNFFPISMDDVNAYMASKSIRIEDYHAGLIREDLIDGN